MKLVRSFALLVLSGAVNASDTGHPTRLLWGDTHVHTYLSGDAYGMGNRSTPDDAYRFARGEAVTATGGATAQLKRPLDFIVITDHAENLGILPLVMAGDQQALTIPGAMAAVDMIKDTPPLSEVLAAPDLSTFNVLMRQLMAGKEARSNIPTVDPVIRKEVWQQVIANA